MSLLRNRSFAVELAVLAAALGVVDALAWALAGPGAGLAALTSLALACALFAAFSTRRYREIARLAAEVDEVLHGGRRIDFADYREGDVAVLKNELAKMTAALAGGHRAPREGEGRARRCARRRVAPDKNAAHGDRPPGARHRGRCGPRRAHARPARARDARGACGGGS